MSSEAGAYDNVSEYVRDLIRRDKERVEADHFDRLKAELKRAFAAPASSYQHLDAETVVACNPKPGLYPARFKEAIAHLMEHQPTEELE